MRRKTFLDELNKRRKNHFSNQFAPVYKHDSKLFCPSIDGKNINIVIVDAKNMSDFHTSSISDMVLYDFLCAFNVKPETFLRDLDLFLVKNI